jgi:IS30 family transposase
MRISREVRNNLGRRGYRHKQAGEMANRSLFENRKRRKFTTEIQVAVEGYLREDFSSEQVTGLMRPGENTRLVQNAFISTFIATTITVGLLPSLASTPKEATTSTRAQRYRRGIIPNRMSIDERDRQKEFLSTQLVGRK